jgi:hypothetical protein
MANEFKIKNGYLSEGNSQITGSLNVSAGITGSLFGTSSYAIQALSSSYYGGSVTSASYAATASYLNTLNQDLTFNGNLTLNGTASITYLNVSYESASVIYSTGSNQFGDAANDTQTLYGSVIIPTGSLTVSGALAVNSSQNSYFIGGGNVGIGTTSPFAKLTVDDSTPFIWGFPSSASAKIGTPGTGGSFMVMTPSLNSSYESGFAIDGTYSGGKSVINLNAFGVYSGGPYSADIAFKTSTNTTLSEKMRITNEGNVGIGTTTPSNLFTVKGNANNMISIQYASDGGAAGLGFLNSSGTELWAINGGRFVAQDEFAISRQGTTALYINSSRNVGIGTTNPDIFSRGYDRILGLNSSTGVAKIEINGSSSSGIDFGQAGTRVAEINAFSTGLEIGTVSAIPIYFTPNGTTRVAITSAGNVGIGTISTNELLTINGNVDLPYGYYLSFQGGITPVTAKFAIKNTYSSPNDVLMLQATGNSDGIITFHAGSAAATRSEKMRIDSSGNVGIGTTSPSTFAGGGLTLGTPSSGKNLIINSSANGSTGLLQFVDLNGNNSLQIYGGSTDMAFYGYGNRFMSFYTNDTERLRIATNGALKFNAYGSGTFTGTAAQKLAVDSSGNLIEIPIGAGPVDGSGTTNYITRWSDTDTITTSSIYETGGNIGIGTTSPGNKLQIGSSDSSDQLLRLGIQYNVIRSLRGGVNWHDGGNTTGQISTEYDGTMVSMVFGSLYNSGYNSNNLMIIRGNGNVGIGTITPAYKLSVVGKIALNDGGNSLFIGDNAGLSDDATANNNIAIGTNSSQNNVSGSQNVAVGHNTLVNNTNINNTAVGANALQFATTAINNTALGSFALNAVTVGSGSTGLGTSALILNTTGNQNTAVGNSALRSNLSGSNNVGVGGSVMFNNANGSDNVALGWFSGRYFGTGTSALTNTSGSIFLGTLARANASGEVNQIVIGMNALGLGSNTVVLGNDNVTTTSLKGNVGIGTSTPAYKLDVNGRTLVNQFEYTRAIDITGFDLNTWTIAGFYNGNSMSNAPNTGWFWVTVEVYTGDTGWIHQTATSFGSGNTANEVYTRVKVGGTWGAWKKLVDNGDISGTTSYIPKFTGTSTLGNSVIYDSSGLIGIGTTGPSAKLHIAAAALGTSTNDYVLNSIHYNPNANSEELEIKSIRTSAGSDWETSGKRIQMRIDSTYMGYMQFNGTDNKFGVSFGTGLTTTAPGNVSERMRINSSGNVGIGTPTPGAKLAVNGTTLTGNVSSGAYVTPSQLHVGGDGTAQISLEDVGAATAAIALDGDKFAFGHQSSTPSYSFRYSNTYNGDYANTGTIFTSLNPTTSYINSTYVGIGTASPSQKLQVDGNIFASTGNGGGFVLEGGNAILRQSGNQMGFNVSGSERMRINDAGNVGIGTTSPGSRLDVAGALGGTVGVGGSTLRLINTDTANYASITAGVTGVTNSGMQFSTDGTTRMIIASSGNVSIGTTAAPGNRLITSQDATYNNENTYGIAAAASTNNDYKTIIGYDYSNDIGVISAVRAAVGWKNLSLAPVAGNVGIGTLTPGYKLDVNGTARVTTLIETSAAKYKTNIQPLEPQLSKVTQLEPVTFDWLDKPQTKTNIGLIADEVEKIYPEFVSKTEDGEIEGIEYSKLTTVLIQSIKELKAIVDKQQDQINTLLNK